MGPRSAAFTGERLLAFFGDPEVDPDPTPRAVALAGALRDAGMELTASHLRRGYHVTSSLGVDLGYATLGRLGFEGRLDYGAVGPVVARAWQLCAMAAEGEVLIGQRAHDAVIGNASLGSPRVVEVPATNEVVTVVPLISTARPRRPPPPPLPIAGHERPPGPKPGRSPRRPSRCGHRGPASSTCESSARSRYGSTAARLP